MPISIEALFKIPVIYFIDLARDGRTLLYSSNTTGIPHLHTIETRLGSAPTQVTHGDDSVIFGFLSPSGEDIIYLQDKDGNELHHLLLTSKEGKETRQITDAACRTWDTTWHPNGKEVARAYAAQDSCGIEIINTQTGENFILKEQPRSCFGVKYSHDGKWIAYTEYAGGKDPKNNQVTVASRNDPTDTVSYKFKDGSKETFPTWSPNGKKLAFFSDANGKTQVVIQDFGGEEHLFLSLAKGEEAFEDEIGWTRTGDKVYYIVSKHSRTAVYEHPFDGEKVELPFPTGTVTRFRIAEDGKKTVALHSSMSSPHCIYLHEIGSSTVTALTSKVHGTTLSDLANPQSVWYKSFDGLEIHAWYLQARSAAAPYPAVVWPHGGPWWQTYDSWSPFLQSLSQSGFAVLAPNCRGSSGYGAAFRNMDISDLGGADLEDVVAGAKWLGNQPDVDNSKIAIMGGSYGGFMTLMALTRRPEVFSAGVALVPVTDWSEMYELSDAAFRGFIEEMFDGPPSERGQFYRQSSPITYVSHIRAPVLISCGRHDSRCPFRPIEKFVKKLEEMGHPHEFMIEEKEGHGFARVDTEVREVTMAVEYLKRILGKAERRLP